LPKFAGDTELIGFSSSFLLHEKENKITATGK
jgi:hypothetical protein